MSETEDIQKEEIEALISIYEGDEAFKQCNPKVYQYKYGEENEPKSFLLELNWGDNYPNELPTINLDTFYNSHIIPTVKEKIEAVLKEEGEQWLGCGMTYTLFECLKERLAELTAEQPESKDLIQRASVISSSGDAEGSEPVKATKKEQLTKAQKRRQWERTDHEGNRARGWNWVDIIKHLSQTGGKEDSGKPPS